MDKGEIRVAEKKVMSGLCINGLKAILLSFKTNEMQTLLAHMQHGGIKSKVRQLVGDVQNLKKQISEWFQME